jgi:hypothetical protein
MLTQISHESLLIFSRNAVLLVKVGGDLGTRRIGAYSGHGSLDRKKSWNEPPKRFFLNQGRFEPCSIDSNPTSLELRWSLSSGISGCVAGGVGTFAVAGFKKFVLVKEIFREQRSQLVWSTGC